MTCFAYKSGASSGHSRPNTPVLLSARQKGLHTIVTGNARKSSSLLLYHLDSLAMATTKPQKDAIVKRKAATLTNDDTESTSMTNTNTAIGLSQDTQDTQDDAPSRSQLLTILCRLANAISSIAQDPQLRRTSPRDPPHDFRTTWSSCFHLSWIDLQTILTSPSSSTRKGLVDDSRGQEQRCVSTCLSGRSIERTLSTRVRLPEDYL